VLRWRLARARAAAARGTATLEYVAAIAVAAVLVTALAISLSPARSRLPQMVEHAVCLVVTAIGSGSCSAGSTPPLPPAQPPFDPKPTKCKITETSEKVNAEIKIAFVKFGNNAGFVETTYTDGTVTYTATDGASLGVTGGPPGAKFDVGKLQRGEDIDFGGGLKFEYGSTWTFKDAAEAKAMSDQLQDYLAQQEADRYDQTGWGAVWRHVLGNDVDPPKPPTQLVSTVEVSAEATGKIGLGLPFDQDPGAKSGIPNLTLAEAGVKFSSTDKWTTITDTTTGAVTYTTGNDTYGQANGQLGPIAGEYKGLIGSSMAITRDKDGQITKVALVTTREGKATGTLSAGQKDLGGKGSDSRSSGDVTVTTTNLDVSTPEQRALVNGWLAAQNRDPDGFISPETFLPDHLVPGDPFQNLMYTNATVSNVGYDNVTDKLGFAAQVKMGVSLGIDISLETTDSKARDATYLGAPGADGSRTPVDFPECESK
jgi:hypothetical protein